MRTAVVPRERLEPSLPLVLAHLVEVLAHSEVEERQACSASPPVTPLLRHLSSVNPRRQQARRPVLLVVQIPYSAGINLGQVRPCFYFILNERF